MAKYTVKKQKSSSSSKWKNLIGHKMREKNMNGSTLSKKMGMSHKIFYILMEGNLPPTNILLEKICKALNLGENGMKKLIREEFPNGKRLWTKQYKGKYVLYYPKSQKPKNSKKQMKAEVKKLERMFTHTPFEKEVSVKR